MAGSAARHTPVKACGSRKAARCAVRGVALRAARGAVRACAVRAAPCARCLLRRRHLSRARAFAFSRAASPRRCRCAARVVVWVVKARKVFFFIFIIDIMFSITDYARRGVRCANRWCGAAVVAAAVVVVRCVCGVRVVRW